VSDPTKDNLSINLWWDQRMQPAGAVAETIRQWLTAVAELSACAGLALEAPLGHRPAAARPGQLMTAEEIIPFLCYLGSTSAEAKPAQSSAERAVRGFLASLLDPTISQDECLSATFICGGWSFEGNGGAITLPAQFAASVTRTWYCQVMESLVVAFDPDDLWCGARKKTGTVGDETIGNPRYWLRWDRGRRPLDPPIDEPTPPARSRPWLSGTLYKWPEHAALFGATPD
jgi:hypothetical protein